MENYEHIITMFDHGQISKDLGTVDGQFLAIFELGEIIKPLEELHKVAIHLDFKPANLLIFYKKKQQKFGIFSVKKLERSFKLIGLDGAFFFRGRRIGKINDGEIENHSFPVSARYSAPEYLNDEISTKSDIWSAALVIYEMLLVNYSNAKLTLNNIKKNVDKIAELYRGFAITNKTSETGSSNLVGIMKDSAELLEIGSQSWWLRYGEVIHNILNVQLNAPEIAFLLTNMLNNDPTKRLSAREILEFLDGQCVPKIEKNANEIPLFGTTDVPLLINTLNAEIKWFKMFYEYEDLYPMLTRTRSMLPKVKEGQKMLLKMLAKRKQICGQ
uniref:Protein kinase domain-containing protein n=1 Tax=Globodera pallida TaxID=36090 RepID=A0A183CGW1_GLOPA